MKKGYTTNDVFLIEGISEIVAGITRLLETNRVLPIFARKSDAVAFAKKHDTQVIMLPGCEIVWPKNKETK